MPKETADHSPITVDPENYYFFDPFVLAIWGHTRSGKSTLADQLARRTNFVPFDVDEVRFLRFGRRSVKLPDEEEAAELVDAFRTKFLLSDNSLVIDQTPVSLISTGRTSFHRQNAETFARERQLPFVSVAMRTPIDVLIERSLAPKHELDYSNISTSSDVEQHVRESQSFSSETKIIDGELPPMEQVTQVIEWILNQKGERVPIVRSIMTRKNKVNNAN